LRRSQSLVFVVDDDPAIRAAVKNLLTSVRLETQVFSSAEEFLEADRSEVASCLVLDVRLPGMSGLDLQRELARLEIRIPVIFITAHGDIPMTVRAMKAGAVEFLTKPFRDQDLLDAVQLSLSQDRTRRQKDSETAELRKRLKGLTPRERAVLPLILSGRSNKEIAAEIGTSEITVKVHRGNLMRKMQATSLADLFRIAAGLGGIYTKV
jgi:FixJ family two-component response regulator